MNDPFDDELRRSLRTHADRLPRRPDLSRDAITQARGIRRRRRIASGIAAAALIAVALPLGLKVGDAITNSQEPVEPVPTPTGPTRIDLDLGALPADETPALPYLDGRTVVGDGLSIKVPGRAQIAGIAPVSDGVYVATGVGADGWLLTRYAADGRAEEIGKTLATPVASADGRWVAYTTGETDENGNAVGDATLVLVDDETGETSRVTLPDADAYEVAIHAIVDGTVYFNYDTHRGRTVSLQTWSTGDASPEQVPGGYNPTAVSADLIAHITRVKDFSVCGAVVDRDGDEVWQSCEYTIQGFSPDGTFAWAQPYTEGYGPTAVALVDTRTWEVVRHYDSKTYRRQVTFSETTFEDEDSLLIRAEQDDGTALLRCDVITGDCATAEPLTDGTSLDPGGPPYLLPDVG